MKQKMTQKLLVSLIALMVSLAVACSPDDGGGSSAVVPTGIAGVFTSISLFAEDVTVPFGGSTVVTASMLDQNGNLYDDEDLELGFVLDSFPTGTSLSTELVTTSGGTASVTLTAGYEAGTVSMHATFGELVSETYTLEIADTASTGDDDDDDDDDTCVDLDGDGYGVGCAAGSDCDDDDNSIYTGCSTVGPPANILVSIDPVEATAQPGGIITIQVSVTDSASVAVANGTEVNFTLINPAFGSLSLDGTCLTTGGRCAITFTASTNVAYINTDETLSISTGPAGSISTETILGIVPTGLPDEIILTGDFVDIKEGESVNLSAILLSDGGTPIQNVVIEFSMSDIANGDFVNASGVLVDSINIETDNDGKVQVKWKSLMDQIGQTVITAMLAGEYPKSTTSIVVSPLPDIPTAPLTMSIYPSEITIGGTAGISVEVFNQFSAHIEDGTLVEFSTTFAGITLTETATTVDGLATATFIAAEDDVPSLPGTAQINVSVGGLFTFDYLKINDADLSSIVFASAEPTKIGVKGSGLPSTSILKFEVFNDRGMPVRDGIQVTFTLYGPNGGETIDPVEASTVNGLATTFLDAGVVAGAVRVDAQATYVDNFGESHTIKTSTTNVAIVAGPPSMRSFGLAVDTHNRIGQSYNNEEWIITAFMADRFSNFVPEGTSISFYSEAGAIGPSGSNEGLTNEEGEASILAQSEDPRPIDVGRNYIDDLYSPLYMDHPYNYSDSYSPGYWAYHNPRDNWNTIVATTIGEEMFDDANANGIYDAGEYFEDLSEPFIDANDNNVWDAAEDWEDDNSNGKWDPGDPFYDFNNNGSRDTCVEEPYVDINFSGAWDAGEPFSDIDSDGVWDDSTPANCVAEPYDDFYSPYSSYTLPETFYDVDGNGLYDEAEFFVDFNSNGLFDGPNDVWDSDIMIWTTAITNWSSLPILDVLYDPASPGNTAGYFADGAIFVLNDTPSVTFPADVSKEIECPANLESGSQTWCDPDQATQYVRVRISDLNGGPLVPDSTISVSIESNQCTVGVGWEGTEFTDSIIGNTEFSIPVIVETVRDGCITNWQEPVNLEIEVSVPLEEGAYAVIYSIPGEVHCQIVATDCGPE
jgi:hypothetical protein